MEEKPTREEEERRRLDNPGTPAPNALDRIDDDNEDDLLEEEKAKPLAPGCQSGLGCATGLVILVLFGMATGGGAYTAWTYLGISAIIGGGLLLHYKVGWKYFLLGVLIMFGIFGLAWGFCVFAFN